MTFAGNLKHVSSMAPQVRLSCNTQTRDSSHGYCTVGIQLERWLLLGSSSASEEAGQGQSPLETPKPPKSHDFSHLMQAALEPCYGLINQRVHNEAENNPEGNPHEI